MTETELARLHSFPAALATPELHSASWIQSTHLCTSSRFPKSELRLLKSLDPSICEGTPKENSIMNFREKIATPNENL